MADLLLSLPRSQPAPPTAIAGAGASPETVPAMGVSGFAPWPVAPDMMAGPEQALPPAAPQLAVSGALAGPIMGPMTGIGAGSEGGQGAAPAVTGRGPVDAMTLWLEGQSGLSAGVAGPPAPGLAALDAALPPLPADPGIGADPDAGTEADPPIDVAVPAGTDVEAGAGSGVGSDAGSDSGGTPARAGPARRHDLAMGPGSGSVAAAEPAPVSAAVPTGEGRAAPPIPATGGIPADRATAPRLAPGAAPDAAPPGPVAGPVADPRARDGARAEPVASATSRTAGAAESLAGALPDASGADAAVGEALRLDAPLSPAARAAAGAPPGWSPAENRTAPEARPVVAQLAEAIVTAQGDRTEIALSPEELGRLRLVMSGPDRAHVTIWADRPETLELLRRNADLLSQQLSEAGVQAGSFEFRRDDRAAWPALRLRPEGEGEGEGGGAGLPAQALALAPTRLSDRRLDIRL